MKVSLDSRRGVDASEFVVWARLVGIVNKNSSFKNVQRAVFYGQVCVLNNEKCVVLSSGIEKWTRHQR